MRKQSGFTIVELLIVIIVIGILAAITIVSYVGVTQRAREASLISDLNNNKKQLELYKTFYGYYPTGFDVNNCPSTPTPDINRCLKFSTGNSFYYTAQGQSPQTFDLSATNDDGALEYHITESVAAVAVEPCPSGYIRVPGSTTYGTSTFCVMKYEAKNVGGVATSVAAGVPWVSIPQTNASSTNDATDLSAAACSGCHLITEAEWLTIVQNVLSVSSNWSGGAVGSGFIYSGHNDNSPANSLAADANDTNGYAGTNNVSPSNQRRTLTLTNGEVIWDLAGNNWEWTAGATVSGITSQPGVAGNSYVSFVEWPSVSTAGSLSPNVFPNATGITGAGTWNSSNGIGKLRSSITHTVQQAFRRGGTYDGNADTGVFTLDLKNAPTIANAFISFRVAK